MSNDLTEDEVTALQRKIVNEGWMPTKEQFHEWGYISMWDIEGKEYLLTRRDKLVSIAVMDDELQ